MVTIKEKQTQAGIRKRTFDPWIGFKEKRADNTYFTHYSKKRTSWKSAK